MFLKVRSRFLNMAATSLVAVMALAACGGDGAGSKSNVDLLKEGAANMKNVKTYHISADIDQAGQAVKLNGDFDAPNNNFKLDFDASGQQISVIKIGDKGWVSMDGGKTYTESPDTSSFSEGFSSFTEMWNTFKPEEADKVKDALKDGTPATEKIEGVDTKHITASAADFQKMGSNSSGSTNEGTVDMWIGPDSKPLIRQLKIDGVQNGQAIKATVTWSKLDEAIEIKAP